MPVPQTLTSGALGLATKWSASSMHTFRLPWLHHLHCLASTKAVPAFAAPI